MSIQDDMVGVLLWYSYTSVSVCSIDEWEKQLCIPCIAAVCVCVCVHLPERAALLFLADCSYCRECLHIRECAHNSSVNNNQSCEEWEVCACCCTVFRRETINHTSCCFVVHKSLVKRSRRGDIKAEATTTNYIQNVFDGISWTCESLKVKMDLT